MTDTEILSFSTNLTRTHPTFLDGLAEKRILVNPFHLSYTPLYRYLNIAAPLLRMVKDEEWIVIQ